MEDTRLGSILLESGLVSEADLERCLAIQALTGSIRPIGQILVEQGLVDSETLNRVLALQRTRKLASDVKVAAVDAMSDSLLDAACANNASELVVSEGRTVRIRVADEWRNLTAEAVAGPEVWDFARELIGPEVLEEVAEHRAVVRAWRHPKHGGGTARVFRHFDGVAVRLTFTPTGLDHDEIGLPERVVEIARNGRGMILVAGERGACRAATLLALAAAGAQDPANHVIVLDEEPVPLPKAPALFVRRRFGQDPAERASAVRSAVREDPDVLVIADVGEAATFEAALRASEDGRLVIGYLDAGGVIPALSRVLDFYAEYDAARVRASLAAVLRALVVQTELLHTNCGEAVVATELLVPDDVVRDALRSGELENIRLMMRMGDGQCGHSLDSSMLDLVVAGRVRIEDVFARAGEKAWLLERIKDNPAAMR